MLVGGREVERLGEGGQAGHVDVNLHKCTNIYICIYEYMFICTVYAYPCIYVSKYAYLQLYL